MSTSAIFARSFLRPRGPGRSGGLGRLRGQPCSLDGRRTGFSVRGCWEQVAQHLVLGVVDVQPRVRRVGGERECRGRDAGAAGAAGAARGSEAGEPAAVSMPAALGLRPRSTPTSRRRTKRRVPPARRSTAPAARGCQVSQRPVQRKVRTRPSGARAIATAPTPRRCRARRRTTRRLWARDSLAESRCWASRCVRAVPRTRIWPSASADAAYSCNGRHWCSESKMTYCPTPDLLPGFRSGPSHL